MESSSSTVWLPEERESGEPRPNSEAAAPAPLSDRNSQTGLGLDGNGLGVLSTGRQPAPKLRMFRTLPYARDEELTGVLQPTLLALS